MKEFYLFSIALLLSALTVSAQTYSWNEITVNGRITGCVSPSVENYAGTIGRFEGGKFITPSGKVYKKCSATYKAAKTVLNAQPTMAPVKKVIAVSMEGMHVKYPESKLSNWFIDNIMAGVEKAAGKKVHFGVGNFGGIRCDMPKGEVILDDLLSMFPFKNQIVYEELYGRDIRALLETMAAQKRFQVIGGVKVRVKDSKLVGVMIDGEPLDDDKIYGVATISFLLHGGDGLQMAHNAMNLKSYDIDIIDIMLEEVNRAAAAGETLDYELDNRVVIE
ncbi:MAG: 5'-nucleotidase C-terminal domain-containing protein [Candidatus Cryptobacteroides sp.]